MKTAEEQINDFETIANIVTSYRKHLPEAMFETGDFESGTPKMITEIAKVLENVHVHTDEGPDPGCSEFGTTESLMWHEEEEE